MAALEQYLSAWDLTDPQLIAETATSRVYTVTHAGETVVLKLLTSIGAEDEGTGALALAYWDGHGAIKLLRHDASAHLLEYVSGEDLIPLVQRGDDDAATAIIAEILNELHADNGKPLPEGLVTLRRRFRSLFRYAETAPDSIYARAARIAEDLLNNPRDVRVLHGDMHHWNVRRHAQRGWLAFDPKGLVGEKTFDAANTLCNPVILPELVADERRLLRAADILARGMGVEVPRLLAFTFTYACLSAAWCLEDDCDPKLALRVAAVAERHVRR